MTRSIIPETTPTHDNQMISDHEYCQRLYAIKHVRGLRPRKGSSATNFGSLLHHGLAKRYDSFVAGANNKEATMESVKAVLEYKDWKDPDDAEDPRTNGRAAYIMGEYGVKYRSEPDDYKFYKSETAFDISDEDGFRFGGRIDAIVEDNGMMWPMDHKSTRKFSSYYFDNFKMAPQMHGYHWGAEHLTNSKLIGVIVNVIIIHKDETLFDRRPVPFSQHQIFEWRARQVIKYHQITKQLADDPNGDHLFDPSYWTPSYERCIDKYGPCSAFKVCSGRPTNREQLLAIHFEDGKWDWNHDDDNE